MRDMRDSGIAWVGAMPSDWNVKRGKFTLKLLNRPIEESDEVITCFRDGEVTLRKNRREDGFTVSLKEIGYQGLEPGDLVIHGMDGFAGSIGISDSRGKSSPVLVVCDSDENKRYIMYYLRSMAYNNVFTALSTGIRVRSCDLRWNKLSELPYILPTVSEQEQIVDAIESCTEKVNALIANVQAQIEKLKAYKQSVITEVVTKGLDPAVPMKDSGIVWIGEIPAHWEIAKLRTRTNMLTPMRDKPEDLNGPIPWVRIEDYCGKYITASKEQLGVSAETVAAMNLKVYPVGTVLCTSSCDLGKCAIVGRELVSNQRFIGIIPQPELNPDYLYYLMLSNAERLNTLSTGSIQANLSRVSFEQLLVQFPPMVEQKAISEYLDKKCEAADRLIAIKQAKIEKLEQYKRSLIYEYVTGKREVS